MTTGVGATVRYMGVTSRKCPKLAGFLGLVYAILGRSVLAITRNGRGPPGHFDILFEAVWQFGPK